MSALRRVAPLALLLAVALAAISAPAFAQTGAYPLLQQQGSKLVGTGATGSAQQGNAVALSADGNTAIVGGSGDNTGIGGAWIFTRSAGVWTQQGQELIGTGAVGAAQQGTSVAISGDGATAIIGAPADNSGAGAAWIFTRSSEGFWIQQGSKLVGTGATGAAGQGISVAIAANGKTAVIGGSTDNTNAGAAWIFVFSEGVWMQQGVKLTGTGAIGAARQGTAVAMSGNGSTILIGGPGDSTGIGAFWAFTRTGITWTQQGGKFVGTGGTSPSSQGQALALSADGLVAAIGGPADNSAAGAIWVFKPTPGGANAWTQQSVIRANFTDVVGAARLGFSMAASADGAVILSGAPRDNASQGAVFMFERTGAASWAELGPKSVPADATAGALVGSAVGISADGNTGIFGGFLDNTGVGAAWAYDDNVNFGSVALGDSVTQDIKLATQSAFSVNTDAGLFVVTQGAPNVDFLEPDTQPQSNNCRPGGSLQGQFKTCSINIQFQPVVPGVRMGALQFFDADGGNLDATVFFYGVGLAAQMGFSTALIETAIGNGTAGYSGDGGPANAAELDFTNGTAIDIASNVYVADFNNEIVRKFDGNTGNISTFAGTPQVAGSNGDNGQATSATMHSPETPVLDGAGNLYIADLFANNVRKVDTHSGIITRYAGTGTASYTGDGGLARNATMSHPYALAIGPNGDLFIAVENDNVIRRVSAITGVITTISGTGVLGYSGDGGPANLAQLNFPAAAALDANGNLFISDDGNNVIREINPATGTISTVYGNADGGFSGDGGLGLSAGINDVEGLALDPAGNVYLTDSGNNAVRKISSATGIINSIAGDGNNGAEDYTGDGGQASAALLAFPSYPSLDAGGALLLSDADNNVVRVIFGAAPLDFGTVNVGSSSKPQDVTLTNNGNVPLTFEGLMIDAGFDVDTADTTCTASTILQPGESCVLGVEFTPAAAGSISGGVTIVSNAGEPGFMVSGIGALVTPTIALTASPLSAAQNQSVLFTATLDPIPAAPRGSVEFCEVTGQAVAPATRASTAMKGRGRPSPAPADGIFGTCDGGTLLGSGNVGADGTATFSTSSLTAGSHLIVAVYSGNAALAEAVSNSVTESISSPVSTTTTLTALPTSAAVGQSVTFTATVAPTPTGSPLGSVSFCLGSLDLVAPTARPISGSTGGSTGGTPSASVRRARPSPATSACFGATVLMTVTINASGVATFTTSSLPAGSNVITAVYSGNAGFATSISNSVTEVINTATATPTTTALSVTPNPAEAGQTVTLTATVTPTPTGSPLGTITFCVSDSNDAVHLAGTRVHAAATRGGKRAPVSAPAGPGLCGSASVLNTTDLDATGTAIFTDSTLAVGSPEFTAVYSGNETFGASTSESVVETINTAFEVTAPPAPVDVDEGGAVDIDITVPPLGGAFNSAVTMSATGLPPGATATFNPPVVTPGADGVHTMMTVTLAGAHSTVSPFRNTPFLPGGGRGIGLLATVFLLAGIFATRCRKGVRTLAALSLLFMAVSGSVLLLSSCSGGFAGAAVTPKGQYVITVTGTSGALSASTTVTLVVK